MFKFLFQKNERFYCQFCNQEIIKQGGYVTNEGEVYCINENMNIFMNRSMKDRSFSVEYQSFDEIQKGIKNGKITKFKKLETGLMGFV